MISHRNVIANTLQYCLFEDTARKNQGIETQVELGLLPFSHIYGLVAVAHAGTWRGDEIIVLPKFELTEYLQAIEKFKISSLYIVGEGDPSRLVYPADDRLGAPDLRSNAKQPRCLQEIRSEQRARLVHWSGASRKGDGRGAPQAVSQLAHCPGIWYVWPWLLPAVARPY